MRLNNNKAKNLVFSVYFLFVVLFVFACFSFNFVRDFLDNAKIKYAAFFIVLVVASFIVHRGSKYFEYDSDGNVLVFVNKGLLLSEFISYRESRAEFPKKKLLYYKLNNYVIYKSLNLYIKSGNNRQKRIKLNVTLLSNKKTKYLKQSLNKVIKQNKAKL